MPDRPALGHGLPAGHHRLEFLERGVGFLSDEGFGLNLIWTRQQPIESFISQVIDHIGGILYTDPEQGTFELKLLRDDYWIDDLPQLGPDEIVRLERFERAVG